MTFPVYDALITSRYGLRIDPETGDFRHHAGIDVISQVGLTGVNAPEDCAIVKVSDSAVTLRSLRDPNVTYRLVHVVPLRLQLGDTISEGYAVGNYKIAGTGAHLHLEVIVDGAYVNPEVFFYGKPESAYPAGLRQAACSHS